MTNVTLLLPISSSSKFLEDCGTIHPSTNEEHAYITYKFDGFNHFEIKVSGVETITDRFKVYVSPDNCEWREVELSFTGPEMSVWRFCSFDHNTENRTR